jgi:hypothetical protein
MTVIINGTNTPTAGGVTYGNGTEYVTTAAGTAGGVLYSAGSGSPAFSAAGTSGQVLTSSGAGAPTWSTPSTGGMTLLATVTPANCTASATVTGLAISKEIHIAFPYPGSITSAAATTYLLEWSADNGSTFNPNPRTLYTSSTSAQGTAILSNTAITAPKVLWSSPPAIGSDTTPTGTINALRFTTPSSTFTGALVFYVYGLN